MNRRILNLALPSIVSNVTVPLLGLVDVYITGHMGDARYLAAIAVASMLFNIIYWLFSFLRFGTGGMTAQAFGQDDRRECGRLLLRSATTSLAIALLLIALQEPLKWLILWIIGPDADLIPHISRYYAICIWGTLPSLALYAFNGWFVGMQNTRLPMVIAITQNVVNIGLSYLFVFHMEMKIEGVALGTLLAQWGGAFMAVGALWMRYAAVLRGLRWREVLQWEALQRFFSVNRILFLRTLFLVAVNLWFIVAGAREGAIILAVNAILMQMFILYSYVMDGFAFAAEALCGRYFGARDGANFRLAVHGTWRLALLLTALYTIVYAAFGNGFAHLLTDEPTVWAAATDFMPWAIAIPLCGVSAFVWDGVFVGISRGDFCAFRDFDFYSRVFSNEV